MSARTVSRTAELSLQLHRAACQYLREDWEASRTLLRENLAWLQSRRRAPLAESWIADWATAIEAGPDAVERIALMPGERGEDLRQVSPLAGVLPEEVRLRVLQDLLHAAR